MAQLGFVDIHNHQFAHLGFGGVEFFGEPAGPLDQALPWCTPAHGPGGITDVMGLFMKVSYGGAGLGHKVGGWPQFDGWPRWDSVTHQTVHVDWLHRAWQGGLRLMVMLAVNNEWMCQLLVSLNRRFDLVWRWRLAWVTVEEVVDFDAKDDRELAGVDD